MNYEETINYLYNQLPVYQKIGGSAYKEGLDNSLALDKYFKHPHRKYKTIHVAGTNGKGSTSHLLAAILQQAGYKVGLYTSPHLVDFRERIRINGKMIDKSYILDFVEIHRENFEPIQPSFFELTMMMAFQYFADEAVDIAIIEVGLGGRLDSTNIISPILSIITNISLDHTQFLGDTTDKIAVEKAGIIKPHTPVIVGEAKGTVRTVFEEKAKTEKAPILFAQDLNLIIGADKLEDGSWLLQTEAYPNLKDELGGLPQIQNASTVICAIDVLRKVELNISYQAVYSGFALVTKLTGLLGRWQIIRQNNPKIICDTGHNVGGFEYIREQLKTEKHNKLHIIIGMVNDKDITKVLSLLPQDAIYYFTKADIPRALDEKSLQLQADNFKLKGKSFNSVKAAIKTALNEASNNDLIFIGGSNFIIAEALPLFDDNN